jgi:peptidoglycan/LPS O-acetylase OafA/YrhL
MGEVSAAAFVRAARQSVSNAALVVAQSAYARATKTTVRVGLDDVRSQTYVEPTMDPRPAGTQDRADVNGQRLIEIKPAQGADQGIVDTQYYSFIDGLRGVAVLMVLGAHTQMPELESGWTILFRLSSSGLSGVQLFFILSAFTLFSTSLQRFREEATPRRNFYLRRAFRILPMWWVSILLYSVALAVFGMKFDHPQVRFLDVVLDGSFLYGFWPEHNRPLVPGGWSLFIEETFYVSLPFIYVYVTTLSRAAQLTVWLLIVSVVWNPASRILMAGNPLWSEFYFYFPLSQWFIFGFGFVLYYLVRLSQRRPLTRSEALLADLVAGIVLWSAFVSQPIGPSFYIASVALLGLCFCTSQDKSVWKLLIDQALFRAFGRCCFSIYLWHSLVLRSLRPYRERFTELLGLPHQAVDGRYLCWFILMAALMLVFGTASFYLFERPMVRLGRRLIHSLERGARTNERSPAAIAPVV